MLGTDDNGGLTALLLGLVVLVFAGIGFSLVSDRVIDFSGSAVELQRTLDREAEQLAQLRTKHQQREERVRSGPMDRSEEILQLQNRCRAETAKQSALRAEVADLRREVARLGKERDEYARRARQQARGAAVGVELDKLVLPGGRTYETISIMGTDDQGIRIHHRRGRLRIRYEDLPDEWQERLLWEPGQAEAAEAPAPDADHSAESAGEDEEEAPRRRRSARKPREQRAPDPELAKRIEETRSQLFKARTAFLQTRMLASEARSKAHGSERSVPGSLETWDERAKRLNARASRLYAQYRQLTLELRSLDPRARLPEDPLVR